MAKQEKAKRNTKTAAERAQEAFDAAGRAVDALGPRIEKAKAELTKLEAEAERANKRLAYLGQNPDLPAQNTAAPESADATE